MNNMLYRPYKDKDYLVPVEVEYFNGELVIGEVEDADPNTKCVLLDTQTGLIVCSGESKQAAINKYYDDYKVRYETFKKARAKQYDTYRAEYTAQLLNFNSAYKAQKGVEIGSLDCECGNVCES